MQHEDLGLNHTVKKVVIRKQDKARVKVDDDGWKTDLKLMEIKSEFSWPQLAPLQGTSSHPAARQLSPDRRVCVSSFSSANMNTSNSFTDAASGAEKQVGEVICDSRIPRSDIFVTTKL
ncbi:hypothetical protein DFQ26_001179 [Actinomortierella ambigua]|nr:hypothetical protein DFQ26_001179 [Actinomortierella ambigua]